MTPKPSPYPTQQGGAAGGVPYPKQQGAPYPQAVAGAQPYPNAPTGYPTGPGQQVVQMVVPVQQAQFDAGAREAIQLNKFFA